MMNFVEHVEGATRLVVPSASLALVPPPTSPVFFNPAASLNRDISVAIAAAGEGSTFCDSMSGVGARGVRIAREVPRVEKVVLVDFNAEALKAARRAAKLNRVARKCMFSDSETSAYLYSRFGRDERFDYVDVDPFGTPIRQLQAALSATSDRGIVSVTATDTAVLCGVYARVCARRYGAVPLRNHFAHETGVRLLAGTLVRQGAQIDVGVRPVFAHSTRHYLRIFARVLPGAAKSDESLGGIGYVLWCARCGHTATSVDMRAVCPVCGSKAMMAGPMWTHGLADPKVLKVAANEARSRGLHQAAKMIASLEGADELPPWSFNIDTVSSALKVPTAPESKVQEALEDRGWRVSRTPFEKTGVKTDAPYGEFLQAVEGLTKARA